MKRPNVVVFNPDRLGAEAIRPVVTRARACFARQLFMGAVY
jgi:hypothetical protein